MTARQVALTQARLHLQAAHRLLRDAYALRASVAVLKVLAVVDGLLANGRPVQPSLGLEPPDQSAAC